MNNLQDEIEDYERHQRFSVPAKRIMEKIDPLKSNVDIAKRRWFWELLQNASDYNDTVDIELELSKDSLKFRHNGNPFTYKDARNLVEPDSAKDDKTDLIQREAIGQFGTGFLATHILSLWIKVSGVIESNGQFINFNFDLDRRGKDHKPQLMVSVENSLQQLNEARSRPAILNYVKHSKCDTEFLYDFAYPYNQENGFEIAKYGIEDLNHVLPYVLSFVPKVKSISVLDNSGIQPEFYTFQGCELVEVEGQKIYIVKKTNKLGAILQESHIILVRHNEASVAVPINPIGDGRYEILSSQVELPKLFKVFPLVGTENFSFPVVVNSTKFEPKTERNGIELSENDSENRVSIKDSVEAYKKLLGLAVRNKWLNLYRLCEIKEPDALPESIKNWYKEVVVSKIREAFLSQNVVETTSDRIMLKDAYIPYHSDKTLNVRKIYELSVPLLSNKLPKIDHYLNWYNILDFHHFTAQKLDIVRFLEEIQEFDTLDNLSKGLNADVKNWLNNVIEFLVDSDQKYLLEKYIILPDQNGNFKSREVLKIDDEIPDYLKDLLLVLTDKRSDYRDILLHRDFSGHFGLLDSKSKLSIDDIAREIDGHLRDFTDGKTNASFLTAVNSLFKWISTEITKKSLSDDENESLSEERIKLLFPWFSQNKAQIVLDAFSDESDRENAFVIVQSGKLDIFAKIAKTDISNENLQLLVDIAQNNIQNVDLNLITEIAQSNISNDDLHLIVNNIGAFKDFLAQKNRLINNGTLNDFVDDETYADAQTGFEGESYVYAKLVSRFGEQFVEWSSQKGEHQYDFKVFNADFSVRYFIDVKTTKRGMANADSIPFFMRYSQWNFLDKTESLDKYFLARVFTESGGYNVKFLKINKTEI